MKRQEEVSTFKEPQQQYDNEEEEDDDHHHHHQQHKIDPERKAEYRKRTRRRGKGKSKQNKPTIEQKVAQEQVELIISKGFLAACWSLGVVPVTTPRHHEHNYEGSTTSFFFGPEDVNWEDTDIGTLMSMVDGANDPDSMERLVQDLALALPGISSEIIERQHSAYSFHVDLDDKSSMLSFDDHLYLDLVQTSPKSMMKTHRKEKGVWGSSSSLASLSQAIADAAVNIVDELHQSWDPERESRVALVVELAEKERQRRISAEEELNWRDRLNRAARIEWAVLASEAERERREQLEQLKQERERERIRLQVHHEEEMERIRRLKESGHFQDFVGGDNNNTKKLVGILSSNSTATSSVNSTNTPNIQSPSSHPLHLQDYEVICPYSVLGCDATLRRSELPKHLEACAFRAEVLEARRLSTIAETYNPLDHVIVCPYTVVGCNHSCRREDLPHHLAICPARLEKTGHSTPVSVSYEVVCPYTTLGCDHVCARSQLSVHLAECTYRPTSRQEEDAERERNRAYAIAAEEGERSRRVTSPRERLTSVDIKSRGLVLESITHTKITPATTAASRRVSWIVKAAEIERLRKAEEKKAISQQQVLTPPQSPARKQVMGGRSPTYDIAAVSRRRKQHEENIDSPPGRRRIVLEAALRRQRLHNFQWFPQEFQRQRTHVHTFHNHMEHQTRLLHKALSEEIETFGRDCTLWELSAQTSVNTLLEKIRLVVESTWKKLISTILPTIHIFGSFASELSVPGVSDLDLVVVPGSDPNLVVQQSSSSSMATSPTGSVGAESLDKPVNKRSVSESSVTSFARLRSRGESFSQSDVQARSLVRDRLEAARRCRILGEALMSCGFLQDVRVIDTASVPVVTMSTPEVTPRLDIDLTVALSNHDGLAAAEFVKMLRARFPPLMPLVRLLKAFLFSRGLANPFHGGLPSYALVLMTTCSLIRSCNRVGPRHANFLSQGELLVDFLDLFGREFDPTQEAVVCNWYADLEKLGIGRVSSGAPLLRIGRRDESLSNSEVYLVVDDPIRYGNNVGRSCFAFARVQAAFAEVLASLLSHVVKNEALGRRGGSNKILLRIFGVKPISQN